MDRFEAMSTVLAVAEAGSLSGAARQTNAPLATVSRKVSDLEAHLRTKLFNRSTRALVPTDAGRSFIAAAKRILAELAEAEHAVSGDQAIARGDLTVSAPLGLGRTHLMPIITEFLAQYPEVNVQISLSDRPVDLSGEHIDIALRVGDLTDSDMIAVRVGEMGRVLCASPAYLKARGTPKSPDELTAHDCISYSTMQSPNTWTFTRDGTEYAVPVRARLLVSNLESAHDAARAGLGITIAHLYHAADDIKSGELQPLLPDFQLSPRPISLMYSPTRFMPAKLRAFLDFTAPRLRTSLGELPKTTGTPVKRGRQAA